MAGFVKKCPCLRPKMEAEVTVLDFRHASLHDVPSEVFNVERTLEELYCDHNQIRDLPRELFYCHGLRKLSISDNEVTSIPPAVSSLANLEELDFSKNGIIDVPENIKGCKYLRSIDASTNPLGKLPEGFTQLANLTHLFLNDTFLDYLPGSFGRMTKLRILEMRENHLKTLPRSFTRLADLERLDVGNNEFTELPDVLGGLVNLLELWCDNNQITEISGSLGQLKQLMFLDASKNQLASLPDEIEGCTSLADLHLTSNCLRELPDSLGNLNNLTTLKADDNRLNSLPKTLGGLSALSELNVSTNDLQNLPASIGLLRNLRTFYADENLLEFVPAELGSCSGITVLSLRGNKLTYIPDELGRIPRLRVLNLSDNNIRHLPFTVVKLKELQALWLTENQTRPLIPLQSEYEADTGRKILTCYLLPQGELRANDERDLNGDSESFHASMWDEERLRRQQIHFDFADESEEERASAAYDYARVPDSPDVRMREARIASSGSPATHKLHQYDKEKHMKDKARMTLGQGRLSTPELESDLSVLIHDEEPKRIHGRGRGKNRHSPEGSTAKRSGSVPDLNRRRKEETMPEPAEEPKPTSVTFEDLYSNHIVTRRKGHHRSRRMKDYDSDTGYRSDSHRHHHRDQSTRDTASDIMSTRSMPVPHGHRSHRHRRKDNPEYASDIEAYTKYGTANEAVEAFQKKFHKDTNSYHQQQSSSLNSAQNLNHDFDNMSLRNTPTNPAQYRPSSPSKSEPRQYGSKRHADYHSTTHRRGSNVSSFEPNHNNNILNNNAPVSNDEFYSDPPSKDMHHRVQLLNEEMRGRLSGELSSSDSKPPNSNYSPNLNSYAQRNINPESPYQRTKTYNISSQSLPMSQNPPGAKPPIAAKPSKPCLAGSNQSLSRRTPSPSSSVFQSDNFIDPGTPVNPSALVNSSQNAIPAGRERRASGLYTLVEENRGSRDNMPSHLSVVNLSSTSSASPPPYQPAPPYRKGAEGGVVGGVSHTDIHLASSDSSSSRMESPHTTMHPPHQQQQQHQHPPVNRSQSSPCGFHGSIPYADLPTSPGKISYSHYADLDSHGHQRQGSGHSGGYPNGAYDHPDNHTTRSGSSSSHIGSASQVNYNLRRDPNDPQSRDRSNSSDSRTSDFHNQSSSQDSHPGSNQGSVRHNSSRKPRPTFDSSAESPNYEDLSHLPSQEQSSQVSSSTDSGYSHGHHVYERIQDLAPPGFPHNGAPHKGAPHHGGPGSHSSATSTPPSQRQTPVRHIDPPSREMTPVTDLYPPDSTSHELRDTFRITIKKNPGLGFSIAGGIGSQGNPYRPKDLGIFVTKIIPSGAAAQHLRPGDKLLEANSIDFRTIEHNKAVSVLKTSNSVSLLVERVQKVNMV